MLRKEVETQARLFGEDTSIGTMVGLLLLGVVGSVSTAWLLLPDQSRIEVGSPLAEPQGSDTKKPFSSPDTAMKPKQLDDATRGNRLAPEDRAQETGAAMKELPATDVGIEQEAESVAVPRPGLAGEPRQLIQSEVETTAQVTGVSLAGGVDQLPDCPPLFTVYFKRNSVYPIESDLADKITRLQDWLDVHPEAKVFVEGYASSVGPEEYNLLLSHRRARAIAKLLADAGIMGDRVATRAFGDQLPLQALPPESQQNQRVSLRIEGDHECSEILTEVDKR